MDFRSYDPTGAIIKWAPWNASRKQRTDTKPYGSRPKVAKQAEDQGHDPAQESDIELIEPQQQQQQQQLQDKQPEPDESTPVHQTQNFQRVTVTLTCQQLLVEGRQNWQRWLRTLQHGKVTVIFKISYLGAGLGRG